MIARVHLASDLYSSACTSRTLRSRVLSYACIAIPIWDSTNDSKIPNAGKTRVRDGMTKKYRVPDVILTLKNIKCFSLRRRRGFVYACSKAVEREREHEKMKGLVSNAGGCEAAAVVYPLRRYSVVNPLPRRIIHINFILRLLGSTISSNNSLLAILMTLI